MAQRTSFGVVGGTNLTNDFPLTRTGFFSDDGLVTVDQYYNRRNFIAGASLDISLRNWLALEVNALHRPFHLQQDWTFPNGTRQSEFATDITTWEFPILLKYRAPALGKVRPFIEGGPSFRTRHNAVPAEPSQVGATVGAGVDWQAGRFRVSPSIRYTRWQYDGGFPRFATKRDQIEFLTSFSYATSVPSWNVAGRKLHFGVVAGTPFTGGIEAFDYPGQHTNELFGYMAGLAVEVDLKKRLTLEVNGIYRPLRVDRVDNTPGFGSYTFEYTVLTWEFPVLAKYRWRPDARLRPIIEGGPSFRTAGNRNGYNPSLFGVTVGSGFEMHYKALQFAPVIRYTRWQTDKDPYRTGSTTRPNQVELLLSFTF